MIRYIIFSLYLVVILLISCDKNSTEPDESIPKIYFTPDNVSLAVGEEVTISLRVENLPPIFGMSLRIIYDDAVVSFSDSLGVERGDFFGQDAIMFVRDNNSVIHLSVTQIQGEGEVDGSGVVGTFTFTGLAAGNCEVRVLEDELEVYDCEGNGIELLVIDVCMGAICVE